MKRRLDLSGLVFLGLLIVFAVVLLWAAFTGVQAPDSLVWVLALWVVFTALSPFVTPFKKEGDSDG